MSGQVTDAILAVVAGSRKADLPEDFGDAVYLTPATDGDFPLERVSPEQLVALRRSRMRAQGSPRFYAIMGQRIEITPAPERAMTLSLTYFPKSELEHARLIAAAPDGLDANREALDFIQSHFGPAASDDPEAWSDPDAREVADKLRSAIAKATGATET